MRRIWPCFGDELDREGWDFEMISLLYLWVVLRETVDAYANVGSCDLTELFDAPSPRAAELRDLLSTPPDDDLWMPGIDNFEITGWLDTVQTAELLRLLPPPAPGQIPVSRLCRQQAVLLLERAVEHGHGVLWSTGIAHTIERHEQLMFADRTPPIALGPFPTSEFPQFFDPITMRPHAWI